MKNQILPACSCGWRHNPHVIPVCPNCGEAVFTPEDEALLREQAGQVRAGFMEPGPREPYHWMPPEQREEPLCFVIDLRWLIALAIAVGLIGLVMGRYF